MITQASLYNFVRDNTTEVVAGAWYSDLERAKEAEDLLYGFTTGGSEYVNDPRRCALHIKERLSGVIEQVQRRKAAEAENKELRQINDILSAQLDSSIIVNCHALACSAPVAAEVERLRAALADIAKATDADNPESYRCDDREGCLDYVYAKATANTNHQVASNSRQCNYAHTSAASPHCATAQGRFFTTK